MKAETRDAGRDSIKIGHLENDISFVTRVLRAHMRAENAALYKAHELASGGVAVLCLIGLNPGISQKDLADAVVAKKSAVTKIVSEMEQDGLLERTKESGDRRYNALHLTEAGEAKRRSLVSDMTTNQDRLLDPLDEGERAELFRIVWQLIEHFEQSAHAPATDTET